MLLILASLQQIIVSRALTRDEVSTIINSIQDIFESEDEPGLWLAKKEDDPDSSIDNGLYGRSLVPTKSFNTERQHIQEFTATLILLNQQMNELLYNNKLNSRTKRQNKKVDELGMWG